MAIPSVPPPAPLSLQETAFVRWLFESAGLDLTGYRQETLRRRLPACFRQIRATSPAEARQKLATDRSLVAAAVGALVIGVTSFFRDAAVFEDIKLTVLPSLRRGAGHPRVWSAGCSTGEELYSVAMLLAEAGLLGNGAVLLGTDCRPAAVAHARGGSYAAKAVADVPAELRDRYFIPQTDAADWRIADAIRSAVQWRTGDLTRVVEPGGWDLIVCRNVVMYLQPRSAARVWASFEAALRPGGYLILGKAERPHGADRLSAVAPCVYRRNKM